MLQGPTNILKSHKSSTICKIWNITLDTYVQQGKTMDNKFCIYVKTLTSLAKWGPGGGGGVFNIQTGPILVHIYPPFNNNLHVKYTYVQQGKTMDNKFCIYVKTLTSLAKWGPGGGGGGVFNIQTGPILVHIYPPFNNNLHVKYRSNLIRTF